MGLFNQKLSILAYFDRNMIQFSSNIELVLDKNRLITLFDGGFIMLNSAKSVVALVHKLAMAIIREQTTPDILSSIIKIAQNEMGLTSGGFILQHDTFWSAEKMLGLDIHDLRGISGILKTTRVFKDELGELIWAEIISSKEMAERFPDQSLSCETEYGVSEIRIPLHYRHKFIGFFYFERDAEDPDGEISNLIAAIMEIVGGIVADVAEGRTNQNIERERLIAQNRQLKSQLESVSPALIGNSDVMLDVYSQVRQVAPTDATVLIRGSSGTGKELVARSIVDLSPRNGKPFLTVNCAALPETLIESELFGHEKGAFTGAIERRIGRAEAADGGTLFLDEIGDLTPATQVKLLRFLQEKTFSRVGSNSELRSNVRFIAATSRNLEELIEKKLFREDLYYRLNIFAIQIPDLADRGGDIILLAEHFAKKLNKKYGKEVKNFSHEAMAALLDWKWTGNVRELENCIERAVLTSSGSTIQISNLPPQMRPHDLPKAGTGISTAGVPDAQEGKTFDELVSIYKKRIIDNALKEHNNNKSAAARALGLTPRMMYYELKREADEGNK